MESKYKEAVILFSVLPNMKLVADRLGKYKGNRIFQITVGGKKNRNGMYIQIRNGEVLSKHGIYEGKADCKLHFPSIKSLSKYCHELKGLPLVSGNPIHILSFYNLLKSTISLQLNKNKTSTLEDKNLIAKMYFFTIFSAINELRKEGNEVITKWLEDAPKKNYSMEVVDSEDSKVWLTVQKGSSKVLTTQSTILTSQCALKFDNVDEAIEFYNSDNAKRHSIIESNAEVREDQVDRDNEIRMLKESFDEVFKYLH